MQASPLISVVMTAWNRELYIGESIDSVLRQTYENFELIVVDDGSTDDTCGVVEAFKDSRIRLFRRPHSGIISSANFGVSEARGKYVARLDSDDISLPERFRLQVSALELHPLAVLCYTDYDYFGGNSHDQKRGKFIQDSMLIAIKMCFMNPIAHSSVMYHKTAFERAGGYLSKTPVAEDYSLYTRLILDGCFIAIPRRLIKYRMHDTSATQENLSMMNRLTREIAVQHLKVFFKFGETQAERIFENLRAPCSQRSLSLWGCFCFRVLSAGKGWRVMPLTWLFKQTVKLIWGKVV
jgi:glycosyltransferase involved in cell wall biosynthesis